MKPCEREDKRYASGIRCKIDIEEKALFELLQRYTPKSSSILDIGCGTGEISREIQRKGYRVKGVDFSTVAVKTALMSGLDCQVVDVDGGLPFKDNSIDAIWATDSIEHLFDPVFVLMEMNRVLKPGGILFATVPYDLHISNRIKILLGKSYQQNDYKNLGQYKHHTFFSKSLLNYMLKESSFDMIEAVYKIHYPYINLKFITRHKSLLMYGMNTIIFAAKAICPSS